jgi:hypothetical protein
MNRFKFRLSLIDLLSGIAVGDTDASLRRLSSLWSTELYLPGLEPKGRDAESYAAELAAFNHCFSTSELQALQQFNRVIGARASGSARDLQIVAEAAASTLKAFQIPQSAPDQIRNSGIRPAWALSRFHHTLAGRRDHSATI